MDVVDSCSEGTTQTCEHCGYRVEHMYIEVAKGILDNHKRRKHGG